MTIDPVCKMKVEPAKADYDGQVYYFCSAACHKAFTEEPQKYAGGVRPWKSAPPTRRFSWTPITL